jgi:hypothetical protein
LRKAQLLGYTCRPVSESTIVIALVIIEDDDPSA